MNKQAVLIVSLTLLCGCLCTQRENLADMQVLPQAVSAQPAPAAEQPAVQEISPATPETPEAPAVLAKAPQAQAAATPAARAEKPLSAGKLKSIQQAIAEDTEFLQDEPEETDEQEPESAAKAETSAETDASEAPAGTDAARLVAQARANQTLSAPVAETPAFKNEPLIPLNGRRLSPFAYEPLSSDANTPAQWRGEQLKFGVYYSFVKAGTAYIKNRGLTEINGRKAYLIQTSAFSASVIDAVFKVRDINYSWIDSENFYSLGYMQSLREGNYRRDEWLIFDDANGRYYGEVQKKEEPRIIAGELSQKVLDMLSSLYFVRAQNLEVGKDVVFDIVNREQQYPLVVKVLKKETVKTDAGKFHCWVVEPQFRGEGIFVAKGKSLKVWLTADEYKMPVKMQAEVFIGSVKAELLEYKRN